MTAEEFTRLAETYGGDLGRWPAASRLAASLLLSQQPELSAVLAEAAALDALLAEAPDAGLPPAAVDRVVRATRGMPQDRAPGYRRLALQAAAVVLCAGLGLAAGFATPGAPLAGDDEEVTAFLLFGPNFDQGETP